MRVATGLPSVGAGESREGIFDTTDAGAMLSLIVIDMLDVGIEEAGEQLSLSTGETLGVRMDADGRLLFVSGESPVQVLVAMAGGRREAGRWLASP